MFGQSFRETPQIFSTAAGEFAQQIEHWGYVESRPEYFNLLKQADVIVSTARHEFFGLAIMEAIALGLYPVLPRRLSYPELLQLDGSPVAKQFFYDGRPHDLAQRLTRLAEDVSILNRPAANRLLMESAERYLWPHRATEMDNALEELVRRRSCNLAPTTKNDYTE